MTVSSETSKSGPYSGNGVTAGFSYTFRILDDDDILVQKRVTATGVITNLVKTTDYTVSGVGASAGGTVTLVDPATDAPTGSTITIIRDVSKTQETNYTPYDTFPAEDHEDALDKLTMIAQEQSEQIDRSVKVDPSVDIDNQVVGTPVAGDVPRINPAGNGWIWAALADLDAYQFPSGTTGILYQQSSGVAIVATLAGTAGQITLTESPTGTFTWSLPDTITKSATFSGILTISGNNTYSGTSTHTNKITMSGAAINQAKGSDIASATTPDLGAATGNSVDITGTTTITGFGTVQAGTIRNVTFTGALTLTHNATSLILPGGVNITTVAGDSAAFLSLGSGNWKCLYYSTATITGTGSSVKATSPTLTTPTFTAPVLGTPASGALTNCTLVPVAQATGALPVANGGTGTTTGLKVLQQVILQSFSAATGTTVMPYDNTIPQNTEGDQFMSQAFTPVSASSTLVIEFQATVGTSTSQQVSTGLFVDSTAGALAASTEISGASGQTCHPFLKYSTGSASTSSRTYKIRIGGNGAGTQTFLGAGGAGLFGGVTVGTLTITEYA